MKIYDVTLPISSELPVWPGDPVPRLVAVSRIRAGDQFNVSALHLGTHTGTHVDAPLHLLDDGTAADALPLETLVGDAWVCRLPGAVRRVTADVLNAAGIPSDVRRLLLATGNGDIWDSSPSLYCRDYVAISPDAAEWVVARGIALLGIDYLSVDPAETTDPTTHRILLSRGVVVVEGLDLRGVPEGALQLICLPLKVVGGDGAPARVVLVARD